MTSPVAFSPSDCLAAVLEACRPYWAAATDEERKYTGWTTDLYQKIANAGAGALPFVSIAQDARYAELLLAASNATDETTHPFEQRSYLFTAWKIEHRLLEAEAVDHDDAISRCRYVQGNPEVLDGVDTDGLEGFLKRIMGDMFDMHDVLVCPQGSGTHTQAGERI